jgi:hypothetical protein
MGFIKTQNLDELIKTKAGDILTIQKI